MVLMWQEAREKVIRYARKLQAERLVYSTAGNISLRIPAKPGQPRRSRGCWPAPRPRHSTTCSSRPTSPSSRWTASR